MIALLRQTAVNRYTWNAVAAVLDACDTDWAVADTWEDLCAQADRALRGGRRVLAFYSFQTPALVSVRDEVRRLRREVPGAVPCAGGPHATADPEGTLALGFDHVFAGEAEATLPAFLAAGGRGLGVVRQDCEVAFGAWPAFGGNRVGPVELTRGCPWRCGFCAVGGRKRRHRPPESVLEAAQRLRDRGRRTVTFITPDALSYGEDLGALDGLLADLDGLGLSPSLGIFPSEVRPERVTGEAVGILRRRCRNRALVIGAQSGSDAALRRLGRGHTVGDVERAARTARRGGFLPHVDLIFGLPAETLEERRATVALARRLRQETGAKIHAHFFHPLPGTPLWGLEPTPLDPETRAFLAGLRRGGAEDGYWQEHERWAWQVLDWARRGWIRTPSGVGAPPNDDSG